MANYNFRGVFYTVINRLIDYERKADLARIKK